MVHTMCWSFEPNNRQTFRKSDGSLYEEGDILKRPKLAVTLERIANDPHTFYNGTLAEDIVKDINEQGDPSIIMHAQHPQQHLFAHRNCEAFSLCAMFSVVSVQVATLSWKICQIIRPVQWTLKLLNFTMATLHCLFRNLLLVALLWHLSSKFLMVS